MVQHIFILDLLWKLTNFLSLSLDKVLKSEISRKPNHLFLSNLACTNEILSLNSNLYNIYLNWDILLFLSLKTISRLYIDKQSWWKNGQTFTSYCNFEVGFLFTDVKCKKKSQIFCLKQENNAHLKKKCTSGQYFGCANIKSTYSKF